MTAYYTETPYHKKRRARFSQDSPPKLLVRLRRKPELIYRGGKLSGAQLRAIDAVTRESF